MRAFLAVAVIGMLVIATSSEAQARGRLFGRNSCGSCSTSCGSGGSNGCKIDNTPSRAAEAVDLFKATPEQEPAVPPAPKETRINYTKDSAIALTSAPKKLDRMSALALTATPQVDLTKPKAMLASR